MSKGARNVQRARERIAQQRATQARRRRLRILLSAITGVVVVAAAAVGITLAVGGGGSGGQATGLRSTPHLKLAALSTLGSLQPAPPSGPAGPEGVPIPHAAPLAGTTTKATGQAIDGVRCQTSEQNLFHIHAHLTIFVNGVARQLPAAIGIPGAQTRDTPQGPFTASGTCFYWLHTHAADGIIHIESPVQRTYTLGDFFDEWGQPLSSTQAGPARGHITALYNGRRYLGNPRDIPLNAHAQLQLDIGSPLIGPTTITWPSGL